MSCDSPHSFETTLSSAWHATRSAVVRARSSPSKYSGPPLVVLPSLTTLKDRALRSLRRCAHRATRGVYGQFQSPSPLKEGLLRRCYLRGA